MTKHFKYLYNRIIEVTDIMGKSGEIINIDGNIEIINKFFYETLDFTDTFDEKELIGQENERKFLYLYIMSHLSSIESKIVFKGSSTYNFYCNNFQRIPSDIDILINEEDLYKKILIVESLFSKLSNKLYVYSSSDRIFQSCNLIFKSFFKNELIILPIEFLADAKVNNFNISNVNKKLFLNYLCNLNTRLSIFVNKLNTKINIISLEKNFCDKIVSLIYLYFVKEVSYRNFEALYDIGIFLENKIIQEFINKKEVFISELILKFKEDYEIQVSDVGYCINAVQILQNNVFDLILSEKSINNFKYYINEINISNDISLNKIYNFLYNFKDLVYSNDIKKYLIKML